MVLELRRAGWSKARALAGGWKAWLAGGLPVEPVGPEDADGQAPAAGETGMDPEPAR